MKSRSDSEKDSGLNPGSAHPDDYYVRSSPLRNTYNTTFILIVLSIAAILGLIILLL